MKPLIDKNSLLVLLSLVVISMAWRPYLFGFYSDDGRLRFAASAEDALAINPVVFELDAVGAGESHTITSKKQNTKALLCIDNMIQSPLVATAVTTTLGENIVFQDKFLTTGITSIASQDIIKMDEEYMLIESIGVGATFRIEVERGKM